MADIAFLDGGLGQEIQTRAKANPHPLWSVKVMYDEPDVIRAVHRDFIAAGARVITANNYTASPPRLRRDGDISQIEDIHNTALRLARTAIDEAGDPDLQLAGCLPPLVGSYVAEVSMGFDASLLDYRQLVSLQEQHVDLFL
ncbi:MAG: homocysteine S-methyltransferase family protein, partial [Pseudomonadota bacterium]|nr:homocysteine S-methyltransferase family protein [Pseudomonadota bacterium]